MVIEVKREMSAGELIAYILERLDVIAINSIDDDAAEAILELQMQIRAIMYPDARNYIV